MNPTVMIVRGGSKWNFATIYVFILDDEVLKPIVYPTIINRLQSI